MKGYLDRLSGISLPFPLHFNLKYSSSFRAKKIVYIRRGGCTNKANLNKKLLVHQPNVTTLFLVVRSNFSISVNCVFLAECVKAAKLRRLLFSLTPLAVKHVFPLSFAERIKKTVEIKQSSVDIEEKGVRLRLTVVDTPGFGDAVNSEKR